MVLKSTVLVVDDEFSIRESFNLILSSQYNVIQAASGEGAVQQVTDNPVDLVYLDIRMPGMNGIETLKKIKELSPKTEVIMVTAVNDVQQASHAIQLGAFDYVVKPFDVEKISNITRERVARKNLLSAVSGIMQKETGLLPGRSDKIVEISNRIPEIAKSNDNVLILGEAGTEKRWAAKLIFEKSGSLKKFISVDIKGKNSQEQEKLLFGDTPDVLFIDNIEDLDKGLEDRLKTIKSRIISGACRNLKEAQFKQETWEALSKTEISLPPLKERASDIPILVEYYLDLARSKYDAKVKAISPKAMDILSSYNWPGNIDELSSVIENVVLSVNGSIIEIKDLPFDILLSPEVSYVMPEEESYSAFESDFVRTIYEDNGRDKVTTAKVLKIQPHILEMKL